MPEGDRAAGQQLAGRLVEESVDADRFATEQPPEEGPQTFRSYDDAKADSIAYLIGQGVPYAIAWQIYSVHGTPMCVHN